ncbi:hypothetical protein EDC96DRAFT_503553 [Choanephora cucurbitarum]|nr:hypothetical protein EDC96DRAFT_503553 [Choanephora cucurbitarum]
MSDEAPMAVLPLNSSSKLDQEPNPFEQSFSGITPTTTQPNDNVAAMDEKAKDKLKLPPVASITSPAPIINNSVIGGGILPKEVSNQFTWDTLRTGPLSPSMLAGPAKPDEYYSTAIPSKLGNTSYTSKYSNETYVPVKQEPSQDVYVNKAPALPTRQSTRTRQTASRKRSTSSQRDSTEETQAPPPRKNSRRRSSALTATSSEFDDEFDEKPAPAKKKKTASKDEDDEKRKNFLERNRIAALKCRQRKKQWLNNLQAKVEFLTNDNERLQLQSESLKEEIVNLKTLLLAHKECPVAQANGFHPNAIQKAPMPSMLSAPIIRQNPSPMMMASTTSSNNSNNSNTSQPFLSRNSTTAASLQPQTSPTNSSSAPVVPQYQRVGMSVQAPPPSQQSMVAGGSSSVLRF